MMHDSFGITWVIHSAPHLCLLPAAAGQGAAQGRVPRRPRSRLGRRLHHPLLLVAATATAATLAAASLFQPLSKAGERLCPRDGVLASRPRNRFTCDCLACTIEISCVADVLRRPQESDGLKGHLQSCIDMPLHPELEHHAASLDIVQTRQASGRTCRGAETVSPRRLNRTMAINAIKRI